MPIYTGELDGTQYDLEGDHEPSEAEARAAIGGMAPKKATPPPASATIGMIAPSTSTSRAPSGTLMDLIPSQDQRRRDMGNLIEHLPIPADVPSPAPGIVAGAKATPGIVARRLGVSSERAGQNIEAALAAGKDSPVAADSLKPLLDRYVELRASGSRPVGAVSKLAKRIEDAAPM